MATFHENLVQSFHNFRDKYLKTYYTCSTARSEYVKELTIPGFTFEAGKRITVKFTSTGAAPSTTSEKFSLSINGTNKLIIRNAANASTYSDMPYKYNIFFTGNQIYDFVYTGSFWLMLGIDTVTDDNVFCTEQISIDNSPTMSSSVAQNATFKNIIKKLLNNDGFLNNKADSISTNVSNLSTSLNNTVKYNSNAANISMTFSNGVLDINTTNK